MKAHIAQIIMDHDVPETYISNILNYGCVSGTVPELTYYHDTHKFFDEHYDEIEEIREDWEFQTGMPINIKGDLKNYLAWFAFEHVVYQIANEAELDY
ncbi:hypothetical protein GCM10011332_32560 [Terasakiella brassicae]|uniref:DUF7222 domain-containing protein n=2 Tax=Terasakiella brassicae TaxID=1634917 RepID=A0A917CAW0_9PROT|nr:hypothetical protein GCM10011332_32560 [Terasakiella brassicae]